ncbi:MAG: ribosome silencing factor [Treponema sp.]|jgi:ribosome-associated protein|nr:ribosome silencing factor [Treponema sp.]
MLPEFKGRRSGEELAAELGRLLQDHRGGNVIVLDLRELNSWTDFFVIATVSSNTHLQGLYRQVKAFAREKQVEMLHQHRRPPAEDEWNLVDLGTVVVHLMTAKSRSFYELERLWSAGKVIFRGQDSDLQM